MLNQTDGALEGEPCFPAPFWWHQTLLTPESLMLSYLGSGHHRCRVSSLPSGHFSQSPLVSYSLAVCSLSQVFLSFCPRASSLLTLQTLPYRAGLPSATSVLTTLRSLAPAEPSPKHGFHTSQPPGHLQLGVSQAPQTNLLLQQIHHPPHWSSFTG